MSAGAGSLERRLLAAVEALSRAGEVPLGQGGAAAAALATRFDEVYTAFVGSLQRLPPEAQLLSLQALDSAIHAMSGLDKAALWTEAAVTSDPRWHELREMARSVLREFGGD